MCFGALLVHFDVTESCRHVCMYTDIQSDFTIRDY
jgi:hypothetical protein